MQKLEIENKNQIPPVLPFKREEHLIMPALYKVESFILTTSQSLLISKVAHNLGKVFFSRMNNRFPIQCVSTPTC